ncbi:multiprotein-bridging factor 1 family protein [Candidatus Micrarchaeota archaeon]|nr:multiprotein-bridging factor 1 family protein [Candidatus Micrarchaeota archaeon]
MESCHICGNDAIGTGYVEGAKIALCERCAEHSKRFQLFEQYRPQQPKPAQRKEKPEQELVAGFGRKIMKARVETKSLSREDFAKQMLISEPDLRAYEEERRKPLPDVAKKIEYALGITLVESKIAEEVEQQQAKSVPFKKEFTLGDIIKIKKK